MFGHLLEELGVVAGLLTVQLVFAVYGVVTSTILALGITPLFLVVYGSLSTAFFLFPLAFYFERKRWPKVLSLKLLSQFVVMALAGVTLFQMLMLYGIKKTSPAVASAMPNLAPGLIFIIAWAFRFENVDLKCLYSKVKILGTLVCIVGAISMSLLHTYPPEQAPAVVTTLPGNIDNDKIIGTLCVLAAVILLSCNIVLQAATLGDFPAPLSLSSITAIIATIFTSVIHFAQEHTLWVDSQLMNAKDLFAFIILAGVIGGACASFSSWAMKKKGPVFVATFNPAGTVFTVTLSAVTLNEPITIGSIFGMVLMFGGLYFVLWAKKKEELIIEDGKIMKGDYESGKPLLS